MAGSYTATFAVLLASTTCWLTCADLPVHCLRHQIAGDWELTLGALTATRSSCGHKNPDSKDNQPALAWLEQQGATTKRIISLSEPNVATAEDGSTGTWTMIYDEGFEIAVGEQVFFAFSNFALATSEDGSVSNVSHCDRTEVGWYRDSGRTQWGCYHAKQVQKKVKASLAQQMEFARDASDADPLVSGSAGFDRPMKSTWMDSLVGAINFLQLGWTAHSHDMFKGKTPRELNRFAGVRHWMSRKKQQPAAPVSFLAMNVRHQHGTFDWRNREGKNWLEPVISQGDCGSCYTIATVHMLTARNRIRVNDPAATPFSVNFPLHCSEYNQGCDGGYGFLQTKWSEDVGLVPEKCAPFSDTATTCQVAPGCDLGAKRYRAINHRYIGGFYGASDAEQVGKELVKSGPLVMSFEPKEDFMYYKDGIYRSGPNKIHQEWEQVDHAVLLIGYGKGGRIPYWTLQNSWGDDWGEAGFFRMARGIDESGIESITVAADVAEDDENTVLDKFLASLQVV